MVLHPRYFRSIARLLFWASAVPVFLQGTVTNAAPDQRGKNIIRTASQGVDVYGLPVATLEALLSVKETRKARELLAQKGGLGKDNEGKILWISACLAVEGREDESVAEFEKIKHLENVNSYALARVAKAYCQIGNFARAKELCTLAISRGGQDCYDTRAACYDFEKHYVEAAADYERAAAVNPRYEGGYHGRAAREMLKANQPAKALALVDKAPQIRKGEPDCLLLLTKGECLEKLNRNAEAIAFFSKAMLALPAKKWVDESVLRTTVLRARAKTYEKMGRTVEAAADRQAIDKSSNEAADDFFRK